MEEFIKVLIEKDIQYVANGRVYQSTYFERYKVYSKWKSLLSAHFERYIGHGKWKSLSIKYSSRKIYEYMCMANGRVYQSTLFRKMYMTNGRVYQSTNLERYKVHGKYKLPKYYDSKYIIVQDKWK